MAFSHVPVALKMILQSGSIGKAAPSYGELCRFESGLCNRAPYTNTVRWPGFQPGDTGSSPVGVICKTLFQSGLLLWSQHFNSLKILDSWPTGRGSRLKPGKGSFDSNTVHLREQGSCACVWFNYVRRVYAHLSGSIMCARSGTSLDCNSLRGWFESICALHVSFVQ